MSFESLSETFEIKIENFPEKWLPLIYLYDPDLPLFPVMYFHVLDPNLPSGQRPSETDRVFGFIQRLNWLDGNLHLTLALSKDLHKEKNQYFIPTVEKEIKNRLGFFNQVVLSDVENAFSGNLSEANNLLKELWFKIVDPSFGKSLPFGRLFDKVFGLIRFIASWNSGGRKGELIQTHCFVADFGEKIQTGGDVHVDFYLLPTFNEFIDVSNPLTQFPKFSVLIDAANDFVTRYCETVNIDCFKFSRFNLSKVNAGRKLKTEVVTKIMDNASSRLRDPLYKNYSAFNRGPQRSIISLMMLHDLRKKYWNPDDFAKENCAKLYVNLERTYQTPKVINLYAQQCFESLHALPIDEWIKTFVNWPLNFRPAKGKYYDDLFKSCDRWGKIERLFWTAAQARKVHSSVCSDILWCVRYGSPGGKWYRGANPLSCKICNTSIRNVCPGYENIKNEKIDFNNPDFNPKNSESGFNIITSAGNSTKPGQIILCCEGKNIKDEYSPRDMPTSFSFYPNPSHPNRVLTVKDFISIY